MRVPARALAARSAGTRRGCSGRAAAHPVLQLQRQAGNRAATQWVQRACGCGGSCCQDEAAEDDKARPPAAPALQRSVATTARPPATSPSGRVVVQRDRGTPEVTIAILEGLQRGVSLSPDAFSGKYQTTAVEVQQSLLRSMKAIIYWNEQGCVHQGDDGLELVRPCPSYAIAGWVPDLFSTSPMAAVTGLRALAPKASGFLPKPPPGVQLPTAPVPTASGSPGQSTGAPGGPPKLRAETDNPLLQSDEALRVATHMISNRILGQHFIGRGISDPTQQKIAMAVQTHLLRHGRPLEELSSFGVAYAGSDGSGSRWVRPAPGSVVAMLLGIGPPNNPDLKGWDGH